MENNLNHNGTVNSFILTKSSEKDAKLIVECKALALLHSGQVGENIWKKEFLCSYQAGENKQYLKKGIFSLFTKKEHKDMILIKTGKMYRLEIICNAKKAKNHWVNNLDITKIEEL